MPGVLFFMSPKNTVKKWILLGIPVLIIFGALLHFVYDWSGKSLIVGLFAPVNESVWEHLKMTFMPLVLWWIIGYFLYRDGSQITAAKWFVSCTVSVLVCPLVITSFYYTYTGALGIESLVIDILSMVLGLTLGQYLAFHIFKYSRPKKYWMYISIVILLLFAAAFVAFTFAPPQIPLFIAS